MTTHAPLRPWTIVGKEQLWQSVGDTDTKKKNNCINIMCLENELWRQKSECNEDLVYEPGQNT